MDKPTRAWAPRSTFTPRWRIALGLVALAVLAAACGSASSDSPTAPSGTTGTPQQLAVAGSINLRASDLPSGWTLYPSKGPANSNVIRTSLNFCTKSATSNPPAQATEASPNFINSSSGAEVGSQVQIMGSGGQASKSVSAAANGNVNSCLQQSVQNGLSRTLPSQEKLTNEAVTNISVPKYGEASFGLRLASDISFTTGSKQQSARVYVDVVGFHTSTALADTMFENPTSPPPASLEHQLVTNMANRARPA